MNDEYVRKDLYDEGIKRIEAMMAASEPGIKQNFANSKLFLKAWAIL